MSEDYGKIQINKELSYNDSCCPNTSDLTKELYHYVVAIGHFICKPDFHLQRHDYNNILIKYTISGQGKLTYRDKTYTVRPNQVMIIKCFDMHEYGTYDCDFWENKWVHFCGDSAYKYFNYIYEKCGPVIDMPQDNTISQKIDSIMELLRSGAPHTDANISCMLIEMLTEIINQIPENNAKQRQQNDFASINTAIRYIEKNYPLPICLKDIAAASNYSLSHFVRTFSKITQVTPYQYLRQYRINQSKSLLISTNLPVTHIASQVGFDNTNSFIRNFEQYESMTPTEYRRLYRYNET